jgi:NAD(P)H-dependent flavin oxidoreductase YrpB (nitropropane dioxygenase family)
MIAAVNLPAPALAAILDEAARSTSGPLGVNFLMPFLDRECLEAAASRVRVVDFFYADPDPDLVEIAHAAGALACWQVGSVAEARAAVDAGCDLVVAQGVEAGGHVRGNVGLLPLLSEVVEAIDVPVVAAGGIATAAAAARALAAGAAGVRAGTRFIAAAESPAHPAYIDAVLRAGPEDTVLTEAFSVMWPGAPHRVLRSCVEAAESFVGDVVGQLRMGEATMPIPRLSVLCPTRDTTGAIEAMALYAGQSVGDVREVRPAAQMVRELAPESA